MSLHAELLPVSLCIGNRYIFTRFHSIFVCDSQLRGMRFSKRTKLVMCIMYILYCYTLIITNAQILYTFVVVLLRYSSIGLSMADMSNSIIVFIFTHSIYKYDIIS